MRRALSTLAAVAAVAGSLLLNEPSASAGVRHYPTYVVKTANTSQSFFYMLDTGWSEHVWWHKGCATSLHRFACYQAWAQANAPG